MKNHADGQSGSWATVKSQRVRYGLEPMAFSECVDALPYSRDDADRIRQMVATPGAKIVCPQCDEQLTMGAPIAGGGTQAFVWQPQCASCGRRLFLQTPRSNRES